MLSLSTGILSFVVGSMVSTMIGGFGLIVGVIGLAIGLYSFVESNDLLAWIGVVLGFVSIIGSVMDYALTEEAVRDPAVLGLTMTLGFTSIGTGAIPLLS